MKHTIWMSIVTVLLLLPMGVVSAFPGVASDTLDIWRVSPDVMEVIIQKLN